MKQIIRGFSIGLFTATIILGIIYFMDDSNQTTNTTASTSERINSLNEDGYYVYEEDMSTKVDSLQEQLDEMEETEVQESNTDEEENETEEEPEIDEADYQTVSFEAGMTFTDIINVLSDTDIISDEQAFIDYLEENELSRYIQVGEFSLHEEMEIEEIASIITGQE